MKNTAIELVLLSMQKSGISFDQDGSQQVEYSLRDVNCPNFVRSHMDSEEGRHFRGAVFVYGEWFQTPCYFSHLEADDAVRQLAA